MAGIYIHIPFCRQACHYCDFHFSTYKALIPPVLEAIGKELVLQQDFFMGTPVETIYLGGGTPSLLEIQDLQGLLDLVFKLYPVENSCEITLEANPDDLKKKKIRELRTLGINRLSIGAQSFQQEFLTYLNRAHSAVDIQHAFFHARDCGFDNINLDLIYAIRGKSMDMLKKDLGEIEKLRPEHISAYCLTIEQKTVFGRWQEKGKISPVPDEEAAEQFEYVADRLSKQSYDHYEISNFSLPGYTSRHNTNYWKGSLYLGVGPSAHSFNLRQRQYNISNNSLYVKSLNQGLIPSTIDHLSIPDRINEKILTELRTKWGCDFVRIHKEFNLDLIEKNRAYLHELVENNMIVLSGGIIKLQRKGMLFADRIASDLFVTEYDI
jgi:oxygen-independent coproporphyrinogen III oxidase